ncbi:MAG TPA: tetratricopeptide repeat protein, partial [Pyrinomonadaceae bacterium]|nr:tetratricopeptide repeat protein [Pyrinomonadaceae bacterium]
MPKMFTNVTRALVILPALAALVLALLATSSGTVSSQNNAPKPAQGQKPPKKKLQANASFAQYAGRDASNRLIAGGATRAVTDDADSLTHKGEESLDAGKPEEAIAPLKRVTELKPESAKAFYNLGTAYEAAGRNKEAVATYKRAVELADKSGMKAEEKAMIKAMSYYNMGNTLSADNMPKEAVEAYKQVVVLAADQPVAHYNLGLAYAASGQTTQAIDSFKKAIELNAQIMSQD